MVKENNNSKMEVFMREILLMEVLEDLFGEMDHFTKVNLKEDLWRVEGSNNFQMETNLLDNLKRIKFSGREFTTTKKVFIKVNFKTISVKGSELLNIQMEECM